MVKGGYPFYGQKVGILVFDQQSPRVPGDPGHSSTFDFQVCYEVVDGKFSDLISGSKEIRDKLVAAVRNLESKGVKAVLGDCGLMTLYQQEMSACSSLPVISSGLILIPLIWNVIGRTGAIGIITGHSAFLSRKHFEGAGVPEDIPCQVQGMEDESHFSEVVIDSGPALDVDLMRRDILSAVGKLLTRQADIRALLLECSNLATYSKDVYHTFNIPVFDIVAGAKILEYSVNPTDFLKRF